MMAFDERLGWLLLGCAIGFIFGYIVRALKDIKEELSDVETIVKTDKDESGIVRYPLVLDAALLIVVLLTVWAAFASQKASNDVQATQDRISEITVCNQEYLSKTVEALNQRTTYTRRQAQSNVALQKAQSEFLSVLLIDPPVPDLDRRQALQNYFESLTKFVVVSGQSDQKAENYPYPTNEELNDCFSSR